MASFHFRREDKVREPWDAQHTESDARILQVQYSFQLRALLRRQDLSVAEDYAIAQFLPLSGREQDLAELDVRQHAIVPALRLSLSLNELALDRPTELRLLLSGHMVM